MRQKTSVKTMRATGPRLSKRNCDRSKPVTGSHTAKDAGIRTPATRAGGLLVMSPSSDETLSFSHRRQASLEALA